MITVDTPFTSTLTFVSLALAADAIYFVFKFSHSTGISLKSLDVWPSILTLIVIVLELTDLIPAGFLIVVL